MKVIAGEWAALSVAEQYERIEKAKRLWDVRFGR